MNCYECQQRDGQTASAVAVCSRCGAATCMEHTRTGHAYTELHSPGAGHLHEAPGRRLYCVTCDGAQSADPATRAAGMTA